MQMTNLSEFSQDEQAPDDLPRGRTSSDEPIDQFLEWEANEAQPNEARLFRKSFLEKYGDELIDDVAFLGSLGSLKRKLAEFVRKQDWFI